jgi:hypothetical protein
MALGEFPKIELLIIQNDDSEGRHKFNFKILQKEVEALVNSIIKES